MALRPKPDPEFPLADRAVNLNCIAQSILDRSFDKAIIITDGYASMNDELKAQLKALTILFGGMTQCEEFESFGENVQLEDICE